MRDLNALVASMRSTVLAIQRRFLRRALQLLSCRSLPVLGCLVSLLIAQLWLLSAAQCSRYQMAGHQGSCLERQDGMLGGVKLILGPHTRYKFSRAKEWQSSLDVPLKDVHSLLHPCASIPERPSDIYGS